MCSACYLSVFLPLGCVNCTSLTSGIRDGRQEGEEGRREVRKVCEQDDNSVSLA